MTRRRREGLAPTLFPFLAVLVCTLGTLILLLALVAHQAETAVAASVTEDPAARQHAQQIAEKIAEERWRRGELAKMRDNQTEELETRRSELAHVEDHLRRLRDELKRLEAEARTSEQERSDEEVAQRAEEIESLRAAIEQRREELEQLRTDQEGRPPRVVIVPHKGPNGTDRRAVYLECVRGAIVIQPEGQRVPLADLDGPLGPGNPLDALLRTVRTHWQQLEPDAPPPYPLLVVRPEGVHAYAAARAALTAWDDQFGYELVPDDVDLAFPKPDAALAQRLARVHREALLRQRERIASMPQRFRGRGGHRDALGDAMAAASDSAGGYGEGGAYGSGRSSAPGNLGGGSPEAPYAAGGDGGRGFSSGEGNGDAAEGSPEGAGGRSGAPGTSADTGEGLAGNALLTDPLGQWRSDMGDSLRGGSAGPAQGEALGEAQGGMAGAPGDPDRIGSGAGASPDDPFAAGDRDAALGADYAADNPSQELSGSVGATGAADPRGGATGGGGAAGGQAAMAAADGSAGGSSGPAGQTMQATDPTDPGQPPTRLEASTAISPESAAAELTGRNRWALPDSMVGAQGTAIVRSMRLTCYRDRFVLWPASSGAAATEIRIGPDGVEPAVIRLGEAARKRIESWGFALAGGRWEPVLSVDVVAGGENNFQSLRWLMRNSGIAIEQRESR